MFNCVDRLFSLWPFAMRKNMTFHVNVIIIVFLILFDNPKFTACHKSFVVSFQSDTNGDASPSTNEWIEFSSKIPPSKAFTTCLWFKAKYFNIDIAVNLWSYCTIKSKGDKIKCIQTFIQPTKKSANRDSVAKVIIPWNEGKEKLTTEVKSFLHRSWAHFCWSLSSISGESKLYYNGKLLGIHTLNFADNRTIIGNTSEVFDAALMFGQEPDSLRGSYDEFQAFIGDLTEFNLWNYILDDIKITEIAQCNDWTKGNVIAWKRNYIKANNVILKDLENASSLCIEDQRFVIFPQKVLYSQAQQTCSIYGGKLAVPKTEEENTQIMNIVHKHADKCIESGNNDAGRVVWIGVRRFNNTWYEVSSDGSPGNLINYTKWYTNRNNAYVNCTYLQNDGFWYEGYDAICNWHTLCTICSIINNPVFTLKGLCYISDLDWNYYLKIDNMNQINSFEGYRDTELVQNISHSWEFSARRRSQNYKIKLLAKNSSTNYPVGRRDWLVRDPNCRIDQQVQKLTLSLCNIGTEFTCSSGHCIDINQRCDENHDCPDGSDETLCVSIHIPDSYKKVNPPKHKDKEPVHIRTQINVLNVDTIDTVNMMVALTMEIYMKWYDERLMFSNPIMNQENVVPDNIGRRLWLPLNDLIYENAIIGEVRNDKRTRVQVHPSIQEDADPERAIENRRFNGAHNFLELSQRVKIKYNCIFHLKNFPFDAKECQFVMKVNHYKNTALMFIEDGPVLYSGPSNVYQFSIGNMSSKINNTSSYTEFALVIPMARIFTNQLLTIFIPTFLLWSFGYSTLFIDTEDKSDRFMGAGTALLVISTLLNSINNDLPKTSYLKLIDLWFLWHITNVFAIITFHIILDRLRKQFAKVEDDEVQEVQETDNADEMKKQDTKKIDDINKNVIIALPILNSVFYAIYFIITLQ